MWLCRLLTEWQFWELPESAEDVFSLFSPADIRRSRDQALENIETLILALTSRLFVLRHHPSFPDNELAPEREALNCVRVLTRILPYLYEKESLHQWEEKFFWGARRKRTRQSAVAAEVLFDEATADKEESGGEKEPFEDAKPLAEELLDTMVDMLFYSEFTIPKQPPGRAKVTYAIWQSGVGCNTAVPTTKEFESNRCELLRLILALAGRGLYMNSPTLTQNGVRTLTHLCTNPDKQVVLSVLCSLLNTVRGLDKFWVITSNVNKDSQISSGELASTVQLLGHSRHEAVACHTVTAPAPCNAGVHSTRACRRILAQKLLSPFPWPASSTSRLSIHCRWRFAHSHTAPSR